MEVARDWLTIIIVLLIVGIVLDGLRRMRHSRKNNIRMSLSMQKGIDKEDLQAYGSELPSGGARVSYRAEEEAAQYNESVRHTFVESRTVGPKKSDRIPEQVTLNLEESVPMLMESLEEEVEEVEELEDAVTENPIDDHEVSDRIEPKFSADPIDEWEAEPTVSHAPLHAQIEEPRDSKNPWENKEPESKKPENKKTEHKKTEVRQEADTSKESRASKEPKVTGANRPKESQSSEMSNGHTAEEVLIINVMAPKGHVFDGESLLAALIACGMRYGSMDIFHRHQDDQGNGEILFSMANMVVPGTFDLQRMSEFQTPGVSLFMTLPLAADSLQAFNRMAATAKLLSDRLGGELKDENRSVMTQQTIEHCRQRIREFERKQLSKVPV